MGLSLDNQYWTSRGYAVLLLNYAGSTGHGRAYRRLLNGRWGVIDSSDAADAANYLAAKKVVDGTRMGVFGRSAGGYLAMKTIVDFPSVWAGAVSLFGISETKTWFERTHKFESWYGDDLVFSHRGMRREEKEKVHWERSPVCHVDRIQAPLLLLQGLEDKVVLPEQAEQMKRKMQEIGKEVELMEFAGEGHGTWRGESQRRLIKAHEDWWRKTLLRVGNE